MLGKSIQSSHGDDVDSRVHTIWHSATMITTFVFAWNTNWFVTVCVFVYVYNYYMCCKRELCMCVLSTLCRFVNTEYACTYISFTCYYSYSRLLFSWKFGFRTIKWTWNHYRCAIRSSNINTLKDCYIILLKRSYFSAGIAEQARRNKSGFFSSRKSWHDENSRNPIVYKVLVKTLV